MASKRKKYKQDRENLNNKRGVDDFNSDTKSIDNIGNNNFKDNIININMQDTKDIEIKDENDTDMIIDTNNTKEAENIVETESEIFRKELHKYNLKLERLYFELAKKIIGQHTMIRDLLVALLSNGHILIEGAPGLRKTLAVESLSETLDLSFSRIQFTPDLLPSDLIGTTIYNPDNRQFSTKKGPVFANFILTDEINRAPSKVQSALLEAMAERQVTIGDNTFKLDRPFIVFATQNPIEQEGTFNLPEAQLDRFLLKTVVTYPNPVEEVKILKNIEKIEVEHLGKVLDRDDIFTMQSLVKNIYVSDEIINYIKDLVGYTRAKSTQISDYIAYPVSPRASIALLKTSRSFAFLQDRDYVIPEDIKEMIYPVFRHRMILSYEAIADEIDSDQIIKTILDNVSINDERY